MVTPELSGIYISIWTNSYGLKLFHSKKAGDCSLAKGSYEREFLTRSIADGKAAESGVTEGQ